MILYACLNTGIGIIAESFGIDIGIPVLTALGELVGQQETISQDYSQTGGFNQQLIFGDWTTVGRSLINFFTGGYIFAIFNLLAAAGINFPPIFILGNAAIFSVSLVFTIFYMFSGRGTKLSD